MRTIDEKMAQTRPIKLRKPVKDEITDVSICAIALPIYPFLSNIFWISFSSKSTPSQKLKWQSFTHFFLIEFSFCLQLLTEMELNVGADVAFLAAQTPPILIFPTPNVADLPYDVQCEQLKEDYEKYYEYHEVAYNPNMVRKIAKTKSIDPTDAEKNDASRVCRDKNLFFDGRIEDDGVILGESFKWMLAQMAKMENFMQEVFEGIGEQSHTHWDKLYQEVEDSREFVEDKKRTREDCSQRCESVAPKKRKLEPIPEEEPKL